MKTLEEAIQILKCVSNPVQQRSIHEVAEDLTGNDDAKRYARAIAVRYIGQYNNVIEDAPDDELSEEITRLFTSIALSGFTGGLRVGQEMEK